MKILSMLILATVFFQLNPSLHAMEEKAMWRAETSAEFNECTRDRFTIVQNDPSGVRLCRSWLLTTEKAAARPNRYFLRLNEGTRVKKKFTLNQSGIQEADLYIYDGGRRHMSPDSPMRIEVNGHVIEHTGSTHETASGWSRRRISGDLLVEGVNTFAFSENGSIIGDVRSPVNNSKVSYDGGENWHPAKGEFVIRLRLHGHPPKGTLTSVVIDAARVLAPDQQLGPLPHPGDARIELETQEPEGTSVEVLWRSGDTPQFDPRNWSAWESGKEAEGINHRYFQWRLKLASDDSSLTPLIRSVNVTFSESEASHRPQWYDNLEVLHHERPNRVQSSYPFTYETDTPRVQYLRDKYELEKLVSSENSDLENTSEIRHWVSRQWKDGWNSGYYGYCPPWDALILLEMAPENLCLGMCTHYATVVTQASAALGYLSRNVIVESHCVSEVFLNDSGDWTVQDGGLSGGPDGYAGGLRFEKDGEPLSALQLHRLGVSGSDAVEGIPHPEVEEPHPRRTHWDRWYSRFAIPLRNDHLSHPEPAEEEHGMAHYRYDGYLWWCSAPDNPPGDIGMYSLLSNREADFYPPVNLTWMDFNPVSENKLSVTFHNSTPGFSGYEVNIDNEGWKEVSSPMEWPLQPGENTIEARSVNEFGRTGPETRTVMKLQKP